MYRFIQNAPVPMSPPYLKKLNESDEKRLNNAIDIDHINVRPAGAAVFRSEMSTETNSMVVPYKTGNFQRIQISAPPFIFLQL